MKFAVGVDLGTTHCVVAASALDGPGDVRLFDVPQLVAPGEVAARELLPSFLYLPAPGELAEHDLTLPWGPAPGVVGELARRLGADAPNRLVASAKSWICHGGVNRRAAILPWSAPDSEPHVSPFDAQVRYLAHLRAAWDAAHPGAALARQDVVVTVPASFDEDARELTLDAAREAGLGAVHLLEEPQAAFYDFVGAQAEGLAATLADARLVLVVDVGGGTTDLTLLRVLPAPAAAPAGGSARELQIERIAVGGHLLLGGDNMDAALARLALDRAALDRPLDPSEWSALMQAARDVKERLLSDGAPDDAVLSIRRRGARLIGGTVSVRLARDDVRQVLLDGFLPATGAAEVAERAGRAGLTTLGLPYATDPAIPRHLCAFLRRHVTAAREAGARIADGLPRPDFLLLNGGVFNSPVLTARLADVLAGWFGERVPLLAHASLDTAVARGAVRYALARRGVGRVIGGGTARAYYIGVEGPQGARRALCVAPRGMGEGSTVKLPDRVFDLLLDRRVAFPLYSYTGDRVDPAGALVEIDDQLEPLPPLEAVLRASGDALRPGAAGTVPVTLSATLNDGGGLELYLVTVQLPPQRWRLRFSLAAEAPAGAPGTPAVPAAPAAGGQASAPDAAAARAASGLVEKARVHVERVFGRDDAEPARGLRADLEALLGPRGAWSAATCRALADLFLAHGPRRGRSAHHELTWLRHVGWCLRPGCGMAGDEARVRRFWQHYGEGLKHPTRAHWSDWWIAWRRVAPGLDRGQQQKLFADVRPAVAPGGRPPPGLHPHGQVEMLQLLAALERLPRADKEAVGEWLWAAADKAGAYWSVGRLGTRLPLHGDAQDVVGRDVATAWLRRLLALDWARADGAAFAAAMLARVTGDGQRDVDAPLREAVAERLRGSAWPPAWGDMVSRRVGMSEGDAGRLLGDSLPAGLRVSDWSAGRE